MQVKRGRSPAASGCTLAWGLVLVWGAGCFDAPTPTSAGHARFALETTATRVVVAPNPAKVLVGDTVRFTATGYDSTGAAVAVTCRWTSDDTLVAKIDANTGVARARTGGSSLIKAGCNGVLGTSTISVSAPSASMVAAVTVSPASVSLGVGGTQQFLATVTDSAGHLLTGQAITWASSAPTVATVDSTGLAKAVSAGSATITATVSSKSGSAAITVPAPAAPVAGGLHEPAGLTTLINDNGSVRVPAGITATPAWSGANGWGDLHTALVSDPTNPTGSGMAIEKRWLAGDSTDEAARPGLLSVDHWSALNPAFGPVKTVYVRLRVWLDPSWPGVDPYSLGGFKFFYLKTSASASFVLWTSKEPSGTVQWASLLNGAVLARVGNVTPGQWHTVEYLFQMNSAPGTSDGAASIWLDGALLSSQSGIVWVGAGSTQWACDFDGMEIYPIRGQAGHTFPQADQLRYGEIYVSGK